MLNPELALDLGVMAMLLLTLCCGVAYSTEDASECRVPRQISWVSLSLTGSSVSCVSATSPPAAVVVVDEPGDTSCSAILTRSQSFQEKHKIIIKCYF